MIADYVRSDEQIYVSSCHSAVAYWIANEEQLLPSDEIVLLGSEAGTGSGEDRVHHSIIMRDGDIIGDTERSGRGIDTSFDHEKQEYYSKLMARGNEIATYKVVERMTIGDFKAQYVDAPEQDSSPDESYDI